jgi:hypothetical protein
MTEFKPVVISEMDADYLYSIRESLPAFGNNIGTALNGSDFGVICFSLCPRFQILREVETSENQCLEPIIWFAASYKRTGMRKALSIMGDISRCVGLPCMTVVTPTERDVFYRQLQKQQEGIFAHPLRAFLKAGHRPVPIEDLHLSVLDDIESGEIHIAPEFVSRPGYELMNREMEDADFTENLGSALQRAFIYSLSTYSYKKKRAPYQMGASNFIVY